MRTSAVLFPSRCPVRVWFTSVHSRILFRELHRRRLTRREWRRGLRGWTVRLGRKSSPPCSKSLPCRRNELASGVWRLGSGEINLGHSPDPRAETPDPRPQTQDPNLVLRQAADFAEGDDVKEERDDERPRFARHQQQNSEPQNQGNHQINQTCQCQFH